MDQTYSGFVAIVGKPNVGKSSLLNELLGEKLAIVTHKPQTTRTKITGVLTQGAKQYVFIDTPGLHKAKNRLGDNMVKAVNTTLNDIDVVLLVVEIRRFCFKFFISQFEILSCRQCQILSRKENYRQF